MNRGMMFSGQQFVLNIASSIANPNIPVIAAAAGWDGASRVIVNITAPYVNTINLQSGWSFPRGIEIEISAGTLVGGIAGVNALGGGTALTASVPVSIRNRGTIAGGGGSGGTGQAAYVQYSAGSTVYGYGGTGGSGQGFLSAGGVTPAAQQGGQAGSFGQYGGAVFGGETPPWAQGAAGGNGGAWGAAGGIGGEDASFGGTYVAAGVFGDVSPGAAGKSIVGNGNITWLETGTRLGAVT